MEINQVNNNFMLGKITNQNTNIAQPKLEYSNDSFEKSGTDKKDKSNNGKFDLSEALKNFGKGVISPITAVLKHPIAAIGMVGATIAATTAVPVLGPILGIGFGLYSVYQLGKGAYQAVKNYNNGEYDKAEKSFDNIGQGFIGTALSLLGIKQGAKIAKEAKMMNELKVDSLTVAQKEAIAGEINQGGFLNALKENFSLLTTKTGLKSVFNQFKPSAIKTRVTEFIDMLKGKRTVETEREVVKKRKVKIEEFQKTEEGIRRAGLSKEQIQKEVQAIYDEAFDKLGIPKEQRPKLVIENSGNKHHGGSYSKGSHTIKYNPEAYQNGIMEMEDVIMHEATHCKEALLRAGIPQERVNQIVKEQLRSRIMNGESEEIFVKNNILDAETMKPPKMSPKMKAEFAQFAEENLYQAYNSKLDRYISAVSAKNAEDIARSKAAIQPLMDKIEMLIKNNPEFAAQYQTPEEAFNMLAKYAFAHNTRYNIFSNVKINVNGNPYSPEYLNIEKLSGEKLLEAEQSLINEINTIDGNARIAGISGLFASEKSFNQYQFSPEEVLAQQKGNGFVIEKYTAKIAEMRANGTLTPQEETRLLQAIDKAKKIIAYKTKGLDFYRKYTDLVNNPTNKELSAEVSKLAKELNTMRAKIKNPPAYVEEIIKEVVKVQDVATTMLPASTIYNMLSMLDDKNKNAK